MGTIAQANASTIRFKTETTWATAPSGTYATMRITSANIRQTTGFVQSAELNATYEPTDNIRTQVSAEGTIGFEASLESFTAFYESLFASTFSSDIALTGQALDVTTVSSPTAHLVATTASTFDNIKAGDWIHVTGLALAANSATAMKYVSAKTSGTDITFVDTAAVAETTATGVQILGQRLTVGSTLNSLTIEQKVPTVEALYKTMRGAVATGVNFEIAPGGIITGNMNLVGKNVTQSTTSIITQSSSVITTSVLNAVDNVIQIREGAMSPAETWKVSRLSVNIQRPNNPRLAISDAAGVSPGAIGVQLVPINVTASMRIYVEHGVSESNGVKDIMDSYLAGTARNGLGLVLYDSYDGSTEYLMVLMFQKYKITRAEIPIAGNDQDLFFDLDITAQLQSTTANGVSNAPTAFTLHKVIY